MKIKTELSADSGSIKCPYGNLDFSFDSKMDIYGISVEKKWRRRGIASRLVKHMEAFAAIKGISRITVPSTPTKEALSFWIKQGYSCLFIEDKSLESEILYDKMNNRLHDTDSGVVMMEKILIFKKE